MMDSFAYFYKQKRRTIFKNYNYLMLESDYPYTSGAGGDSSNCQYSSSKATKVRAYDYDFLDWPSVNEMKTAVQ